jgi:hypothetical protein
VKLREGLATSAPKISHPSKPEKQGVKVRYCFVAMQKKKKKEKRKKKKRICCKQAGLQVTQRRNSKAVNSEMTVTVLQLLYGVL